jgi:hypothetical protein
MMYSSWTGFLYTSSACKDMSEGLAALEWAMKIAGMRPLSGEIRPYKNFDPCIPGHTCRIALPKLKRALRQLARTAEGSFALALRVIAQAEANGIREFDVRLSGPVGPAPDREGRDASPRRPAPRRPLPRRPRPKRVRPRPKRRAR